MFVTLFFFGPLHYVRLCKRAELMYRGAEIRLDHRLTPEEAQGGKTLAACVFLLSAGVRWWEEMRLQMHVTCICKHVLPQMQRLRSFNHFTDLIQFFNRQVLRWFNLRSPQSSDSELLLTPPEWIATIGFQKVEWATQILVKVSRLTVNSSAPKPHLPLHRFSECGVKGLVRGRGGGAPNVTVAFPPHWKEIMRPSSDIWRRRNQGCRKLCKKCVKAHKMKQKKNYLLHPNAVFENISNGFY